MALGMGYPVVLRNFFSGYHFQGRRGGVVAGITSEQELREEYEETESRVKQILVRNAHINGITIQMLKIMRLSLDQKNTVISGQ